MLNITTRPLQDGSFISLMTNGNGFHRLDSRLEPMMEYNVQPSTASKDRWTQLLDANTEFVLLANAHTTCIFDLKTNTPVYVTNPTERNNPLPPTAGILLPDASFIAGYGSGVIFRSGVHLAPFDNSFRVVPEAPEKIAKSLDMRFTQFELFNGDLYAFHNYAGILRYNTILQKVKEPAFDLKNINTVYALPRGKPDPSQMPPLSYHEYMHIAMPYVDYYLRNEGHGYSFNLAKPTSSRRIDLTDRVYLTSGLSIDLKAGRVYRSESNYRGIPPELIPLLRQNLTYSFDRNTVYVAPKDSPQWQSIDLNEPDLPVEYLPIRGDHPQVDLPCFASRCEFLRSALSNPNYFTQVHDLTNPHDWSELKKPKVGANEIFEYYGPHNIVATVIQTPDCFELGDVIGVSRIATPAVSASISDF